MKKTITVFMLAILLATPLLAGGRGKSKSSLKGSYPVVMVHGILGFDDRQPLLGVVSYWGGMDDHLRSKGAPVLTPGLSAMNDDATRAAELKPQVNYWMAANNYRKVHLLAHSQGGSTSRFMTSNLGMAGKIASITTINSLHRGTPVGDIALKALPDWLEPAVAVVINAFGRIIYGEKQDILAMAEGMTTRYMNALNETTPNVSSVDYFSYGSRVTLPDPIQHPLMFLTFPITALGGASYDMGTANDGIVPFSSMKWGKWKGEPDYRWYTTGVDHLQITNWAYSGELWYDVKGFYLKMARNAFNNQ